MIKIQPLTFPWKTQDPFLFCAFHKDDYPTGNGALGPDASHLAGRAMGSDFGGKDGFSMYHGQKVPGFPGHPHRGFETITIAEKGMVDHSDSMGASGRFGHGDVQWMTAGKGVQHSEMFPLLNEEQDNPMVLFQIWLNLPRKSKMVEPYFGMLWNEDIPRHTHTDAQGKTTEVKVISGQLGEIDIDGISPDSWAANPYNEVAVWLIHMEAGAEWNVPTASGLANRSLYLYEGSTLEINGQTASVNSMIESEADVETVLKNGDRPASLLFLQGRPIGEPVAQHGPFVMNSPQEIQQAIMDYQRTQFGGWPWPEYEHTHGKERGRFAQHADGRLEEK